MNEVSHRTAETKGLEVANRSGYPSGLCASDFELLIRYFWKGEPDSVLDRDSAFYKAAKRLLAGELLQTSPEVGVMYTLSERGAVLARHICNLPLPVATWEMR